MHDLEQYKSALPLLDGSLVVLCCLRMRLDSRRMPAADVGAVAGLGRERCNAHIRHWHLDHHCLRCIAGARCAWLCLLLLLPSCALTDAHALKGAALHPRPRRQRPAMLLCAVPRTAAVLAGASRLRLRAARCGSCPPGRWGLQQVCSARVHGAELEAAQMKYTVINTLLIKFEHPHPADMPRLPIRQPLLVHEFSAGFACFCVFIWNSRGDDARVPQVGGQQRLALGLLLLQAGAILLRPVLHHFDGNHSPPPAPCRR